MAVKTVSAFVSATSLAIPATQQKINDDDDDVAVASSIKKTTHPLLTVVPPNEGFRNTSLTGGELSIVSLNLLAPFYNSLGLSKNTSDYERWEFLHRDRTERVPEAISMAKNANADILCLQEIEGGQLGTNDEGERQFTLRDEIKGWLAENTEVGETFFEGYDSFVWSPLNPNNKRGDVVGLCVAWRSKKCSLVEWEGYRRGMVCQFQENIGPTSSFFSVANLHLPARPSNILGRLHSMSRTIRKLTQLDQNRDKSSFSKTLNGLIVVAGDFNSDQHSVAARLLSHGYTNHGNIRDRNYSAKITKASAKDMNHPYRFIDVYENSGGFGNSRNDPRFKHNTLRELYAPVTVSLKGRGPGIMDHLFYATVSSSSKILGKQYRTPSKLVNEKKNMQQLSTTSTKTGTVDLTTKPSSPTFLSNNLSSGKRRKRRDKAKSRFGGTASTARVSNNDPKIYIDSILATIRCDGNDVDDKNDKGDERLRIIYEGLPNLKEGFPSDHLPVGALLSTVPAIKYDSEQTNENINDTYTQGRVEKARGITSTVERRRRNSQASYGLRRRHNLVLNAITEWLVGLGASSVVLDKPLYKNKLLSRTMGGAKPLQQHIKRKSRAPDLMCILVDDNDNDNDNDNDDNNDNDNDGDDKVELLSFEAGKKVNSVDLPKLPKELDSLFDNDIQGKREGNNDNLLLVPAATGNNNEEELNRDKKALLDSDGGVEQNVALVVKDNNCINGNGKESNRNETTTIKLISTRPTSRGEENGGTKRIFKGEILSDKSHDKSSLYIIRKGKTKESIKKITSKSFQVKEDFFSCKSTTIGRILRKKIEDRTSLRLSKKKVLRDDSKWYNRKRYTKKIDESVSFMRSTECFSNYICQTQRQLKQKAEEKKRCAKKIVI